jgi:hypothetical protein
MVAQGDQAIPPAAKRLFAKRMGATTVVSHPDDVVKLIETAAKGVSVPT